MAENKNWLAQLGYDIEDQDLVNAGVSPELLKQQGINRAMIDLIHQENVSSYVGQGMSEAEAKHLADKKRSEALKAAKANGLEL
jgi:hypothetical protein